MRNSMNFDIKHPIHSFMLELRRRNALRRLNKDFAQLTDKELDDLLAEAGIQRKDLFTSFDGNTPRRRLMGRMLMHFGIDRERASQHHWGHLVRAESRCTRCLSVRRCQRWFEAHNTNIEPKTFCPNAAVFENIRSAQAQFTAAKARIYPYIPDSLDSKAVWVELAWKAVRSHEEKPFWRQ